jgi:hypothetical protein
METRKQSWGKEKEERSQRGQEPEVEEMSEAA